MSVLSPSQEGAFRAVAAQLGVRDPQWLIDLVRFESGFDPKAKNPFSSARGLIQFLDATARGLGYRDSLDLVTKNPTVEGQLKGPVYKYLKPYAPFNDEYQLYMAVFFPAARKYPRDTPFKEIFQDIYGPNWKIKWDAFKSANPLITSPENYVNYVKKKPMIRVAAKGGGILLAVGAGYLLYQTLS